MTAYIVEARREWVTWMWLCPSCMEERTRNGWTCTKVGETDNRCDDCETKAQAEGLVREWAPAYPGERPSRQATDLAETNTAVEGVSKPRLQGVQPRLDKAQIKATKGDRKTV